MRVSRAAFFCGSTSSLFKLALSVPTELDAHYARLLAEGRDKAATTTAASSDVKDEPGSSRAPSPGASAGQDDGDGEDEMEAVDTNVNRAEEVEALKSTIVKGELRTGIRLLSVSCS